MSGSADDFLERWRAQDPALRLAEIYDRSGRLGPTLGLYFELAETLYRLSGRRVSEGKLAWWQDEAQAMLAGQPRHPLTRAVAVDDRANAAALIRASWRLFDAATAVDRPALEAQRRPLLEALAGLLGGQVASASEPSAMTSALIRLDDAFRLASIGIGAPDLCSPLTLADWARLGVSRQTLVDAPAGRPEVRRNIARQWFGETSARSMSSPGLNVYVGLWERALQHSGETPKPGLALAWRAWGARRASKSVVGSRECAAWRGSPLLSMRQHLAPLNWRAQHPLECDAPHRFGCSWHGKACAYKTAARLQLWLCWYSRSGRVLPTPD
jgi:hypothetical protein